MTLDLIGVLVLIRIDQSSVVQILMYGGVAEWLKATDCKSVLSEYAGSNPAPTTILLVLISSVCE